MATESNQQLLENRLFSHFRGWTWSERGRDTSSWLWDEDYDIQKDSTRRWVCKTLTKCPNPPMAKPSYKRTGRREPPAKRPRFFNPFDFTDRVGKLPRTIAMIGDEYIAWQERYPRLSRMAMDFLTIQPMSAEGGRVFSAAGKMAIASRASLEAQTIGVCQVLRSRYRAGILQGNDNDILPLSPQNGGGNNEASKSASLESKDEAYSEAYSVEDAGLPTSGSDSE
ncbi:Acyl-coenzyme A thioesterase 8 [Apiospora arundinis]|uniref:Acyl-coenzyme A thioesterase 8 n=1 Tax=Apiospora arundinis TaxID=335852 RepID=A0ABR2IZ10_9PEZI